MTRSFLIACTVLWLPAVALAQSTVTLDSFKLDDPPKPDAAATEMRDCLLNPDACESAEFKSGASITLDDVVNLGVVERKPEPVAVPGQPTTSIAVVDREPPKPLPTIDLEILFAYDSFDLTPEARIKLSSLASALQDPSFKDRTLIFIGHTDAVGSAAYNRLLSQRRADAVAQYVRQTMNLPTSKIQSVGVGFDKLKNVYRPDAAENRRVQVVVFDPNT
ncbi:OmpA family protein [Maliponia aquimaris]|uniref:Outer membrane protein A n=1 Tax=Maliponia aquimaris TaxID=1673631 RepID=A0A238L472_9RHOB|nr:OmpA family protein [Maliponia aquimaris]SMX49116.1 Outer membrane protein A precursor [Maliponia aquimaris]